MKKIIFYSLLVLTVGLFFACQSDTKLPTESSEALSAEGNTLEKGKVIEVDVTIENLAPATGPGASQPLSPPILATHTPAYHIFQVGHFASKEVAQVAEDAFGDPLIAKLNDAIRVFDVAQGDGVILPGKSAKVRIKMRAGFRFLSIVTMLVNTNDAFAGLDGLLVPLRDLRNKPMGKAEYYLYAYDAGSEKNTEMKEHIPGPCCGNPFVRVPTHEKIKMHPGIMGTGDLDPAIYGWDEPIAKITVMPVGIH